MSFVLSDIENTFIVSRLPKPMRLCWIRVYLLVFHVGMHRQSNSEIHLLVFLVLHILPILCLTIHILCPYILPFVCLITSWKPHDILYATITYHMPHYLLEASLPIVCHFYLSYASLPFSYLYCFRFMWSPGGSACWWTQPAGILHKVRFLRAAQDRLHLRRFYLFGACNMNWLSP